MKKIIKDFLLLIFMEIPKGLWVFVSDKKYRNQLLYGENPPNKMHLDKITQFPKITGAKKVKPKKMAVVGDNCTGCGACVPACPVDCISWLPPETRIDQYSEDWRPVTAVQVRFQECIGCDKCAQVCTYATWDAIKMIPTVDFETETGIAIEAKIPENPPSVFQINTEWLYKHPSFEV